MRSEVLKMVMAFPATAASLAEACRERAASGDATACEQAVKADPGNLELRRALARAYIELGDFEAAIEVQQGIASERPNDAKALRQLGGSLGFVRRYVEAASVIERLIALEPGHAPHHATLAVIYTQLKRPGDVLRETRRAADLGDPVAMNDMFRFLRDGLGVEVDQGAALVWAERAAEAGNLGAMKTLTRIYLDGLIGAPVNEARAIHWAERFREAR